MERNGRLLVQDILLMLLLDHFDDLGFRRHPEVGSPASLLNAIRFDATPSKRKQQGQEDDHEYMQADAGQNALAEGGIRAMGPDIFQDPIARGLSNILGSGIAGEDGPPP